MAKAKKDNKAEMTEKAEEVKKAETAETVQPAAETAEEPAADTAAAAAVADPAAPVEEFAKRGGGKGPNINKKTRISYEKKKKLYGYIFIAGAHNGLCRPTRCPFHCQHTRCEHAQRY